MKRSTFTTLIAVLGLMIAGIVAQAQVTVTLSPSLVSVLAGQEAFFNGTVTNNTESDVFLNNMSFTFTPSGNSVFFTPDTNVFFNNVPGIIFANGDSYTGPMFGMGTSGATPAGDYLGTATILGGADPDATSSVTSSPFTIRITRQSVPEPISVALLSISVLGSMVFLRSRRTNK
ncbi:MAG: hypothetical protein ABJA67_08180 [Chthonomonadales bacterium]